MIDAYHTNRFLLAKHQLERLEKVIGKVRRAKDILPILESWPQGIYGMYEKMLGDIPETCQEELPRALLLVCFSKVFVTLAETAEFAVVKSGSWTRSLSDRFGSPEELLLLSGSLFVNSTTRIYLSHHSIQEYLISDHIKAGPARFFALDKNKAAEDIFRVCLTCLKFLDVSNPGTSNEITTSMTGSLQYSGIQKLNRDYPLVNLASLQWISSPPAFFEKYKNDVEFVLTSHKCLTRGFWWVLHHFQSPASIQLLPEARSQGNSLEKCQLAMALARPVLQYYSSPWISSSWTINDLHTISVPSPGGPPLFTRSNLYVPTNMTRPNNGSDTSEVTPRSSYRHAPLMALGILLLELNFGAPLDNLVTFSSEVLRDIIFPDLINNLSESSGSRYARAVQLCLSSGFGEVLTGDMTDSDIRETIYRDVVQPLETALQPYDTFRQNMGLLACAEAPENISAGIRRIMEAYLIFYPEQRFTMRVEDIKEITEEMHLDQNRWSLQSIHFGASGSQLRSAIPSAHQQPVS